MGHETTPEQPRPNGADMGQPPETASPYAELGHSALIDRYYETEGDVGIGQELSVRFFRHADLGLDPWTTPLIGSDDKQVQLDGRPLMLSDYVNFAASHHFEAIGEILDFLEEQPGSEGYKAARAAIVLRLNPPDARY